MSLQSLYHELLETAAARREKFRERRLSIFKGLAGAAYDRGLLVVGRAVNGWVHQCASADLADEQIRRSVVETLLRDSNSCPMEWVATMSVDGKDENGEPLYNTRRSAYWRVARPIAARTGAGIVLKHWSSAIAWTNLYKLSPADKQGTDAKQHGGNPSAALRQVQLDTCCRILAAEIEVFAPRQVLFLTSIDWFAPFAKAIGFQPGDGRGGYVEAVGELRINNFAAPAVVAKHPQGKKEASFVAEVLAAFDGPHKHEPTA